MRRTENINGLTIFNNNWKMDIKTFLTSDIARLTFMVTVMSIGLYLIQYLNPMG